MGVNHAVGERIPAHGEVQILVDHGVVDLAGEPRCGEVNWKTTVRLTVLNNHAKVNSISHHAVVGRFV